MPRFIVQDPGVFTTVQDAGRKGYRKFGVPQSGAMDDKAYNLANQLVGNPVGSAVLELTMKGGNYRFENDAVIALTGAIMDFKRNGIVMPMNRSISINKGDELEIGYARRGFRSYLAIRGKLEITPVMGSCSTYVTGNFGGFKGRTLEKGDEIRWSELEGSFQEKKAEKSKLPFYSSSLVLKTFRGPEWDWLNEKAKQLFLGAEFSVSQSSNRMGIRLAGAKVQVQWHEMISSPVIPGIIQLPPGGEPIILHKDGQTIGGYPRIAKVADDELWRLGQVKPGDSIRFELKEISC